MTRQTTGPNASTSRTQARLEERTGCSHHERWEPIAEQLPPLLQAFHNMSPSRQNMLALEVFAPRTYDELERPQGSTDAH